MRCREGPGHRAKKCQPCIAGFPDTWPLGALVDDIVPPGVRCTGIVGHQPTLARGGEGVWGWVGGSGQVQDLLSSQTLLTLAKDVSWSLFATARVDEINHTKTQSGRMEMRDFEKPGIFVACNCRSIQRSSCGIVQTSLAPFDLLDADTSRRKPSCSPRFVRESRSTYLDVCTIHRFFHASLPHLFACFKRG